jgi:hypothetical protein
MSLKQWASNGWLRPHKTSAEEIGNLLAIVKRDMSDSAEDTISADWRFGIAYNAALKLCTILLSAEGFRPEKALAHYRTLQALPLILGSSRKEDAEYLDACRAKRNTVEYDFVGGATDADADELMEFVAALEVDVIDWLKTQHPNLLK